MLKDKCKSNIVCNVYLPEATEEIVREYIRKFYLNKRYGNCIEGISKQKLYKNGYKIYIEYWSDKISQQNIITKLKHLTEENYEYVYTQKRDKTGLFKVTIYIKER